MKHLFLALLALFLDFFITNGWRVRQDLDDFRSLFIDGRTHLGFSFFLRFVLYHIIYSSRQGIGWRNSHSQTGA